LAFFGAAAAGAGAAAAGAAGSLGPYTKKKYISTWNLKKQDISKCQDFRDRHINKSNTL